MRRVGVALLALIALAGCSRGEETPPEAGVVLWQSERPQPRFPVPPEAAWMPKYQRLRMALTASASGPRQQWACYRGGALEKVVDFYAPLYGLDPAAVVVTREPAASFFATVRSISSRLGAEIPAQTGVAGVVRRVNLPQRGLLPGLILESPFPEPGHGRLDKGTLISLHWQEPGGAG